MNVLVYSDKEKKPKKRSEFNSVYNKVLLPQGRKWREGACGLNSYPEVHSTPAGRGDGKPRYTLATPFLRRELLLLETEHSHSYLENTKKFWGTVFFFFLGGVYSIDLI